MLTQCKEDESMELAICNLIQTRLNVTMITLSSFYLSVCMHEPVSSLFQFKQCVREKAFAHMQLNNTGVSLCFDY